MSVKNLYIILGITATVAILSSCGKDPESPGRVYIPDMHYSQAYEYYTVNPTLTDSLGIDSVTTRKPVAGTISRGMMPSGSDSVSESYLYTRYYKPTPEDYERAGRELTNPLPLTDENLAEGKAKFTIYCQPCHGADGGGQGPVVKNSAFPPIPNTYAEYFSSGLTVGKAFHTITYGKNNMGSYASQLKVEDRWKVIYYIEKLAKAGPFAPDAPKPDNSGEDSSL